MGSLVTTTKGAIFWTSLKNKNPIHTYITIFLTPLLLTWVQNHEQSPIVSVTLKKDGRSTDRNIHGIHVWYSNANE